jgi:hypothetical protein
MKRQNKSDEFEMRAAGLEEIFKRHDVMFESKYSEIKQVLMLVN